MLAANWGQSRPHRISSLWRPFAMADPTVGVAVARLPTFVVGDIGVDVVLDENAHQVIAPHLACVAERRAARSIL